jgi:hypothetical protein
MEEVTDVQNSSSEIPVKIQHNSVKQTERPPVAGLCSEGSIGVVYSALESSSDDSRKGHSSGQKE